MQPYAVVAGIDLNGLGVLRSLGGEGVPLVAVDTDLTKPTMATRFGQKIRIAALSGPTFIEALTELRGRFDANPVLFVTQEASVASVSDAREKLGPIYRFTLPPADIVRSLQDKLRFQALAKKNSFLVPRGVSLSRSAGTEPAHALRFSCVVKSITKDARYGERFGKASKVASSDELEQLWSRMSKVVDEVIVQEWIEGGDENVYFCLQYRPAKGESTSFAGRKLCQWPPLVGGTASCVPAPEAAEELTRLTDRFFTRVGFVGLGSMEFKRDRRDGLFYMVEPTVGRTDYQEEIAALNGINIPYVAYLGELGEGPPALKTAPSPIAWRDPIGYANARAAGAPDVMSKLSPNIRICDAYFRLNDPMPYIALKLQAVKCRLAR